MTFKIDKSDITREKLLQISDFSEKTVEKIKTSDILIVPSMQFRATKDRLFYQGTSDFLKLARNELSEYTINLCENDGSEKSLTLHAGEIWLPILLVSIDPIKDVLLPTIISFISNYIFYKYTEGVKEDKMDIHLKILVENKNNGVTKTITYDGKVSGLKDLKIDSRKIFE